MAVNTISLLENLLIHYNPELVDQIYRRSPTLDWIKGNSRPASGEQIQIKMKSAFSESTGARAENAALPTPDTVGHSLASFTTKFNYHTIDVSRPAMMLSAGPASLADTMQVVMSDAADAFADDINRQLHGDGSGKLAVSDDTSASDPTSVVERRINSAINNVKIGQVLDFIVNSTGAVDATADGVTVTAVTATSVTTGTAPTSAVDGNYFVRDGSFNNEMYGLAAAIDNGNTPTGITNYGGIDRSLAANDFYDSTVIAAASGTSTAPLTEDLLQRLIDDIEIKSGDVGSITDLWMPYQIRRKYQALLRPDRRFQGMMFTAGGADVEMLSFNGIPVRVDKHCFANTVYAVNKNRFFLYKAGDPAWVADDGSVLDRTANDTFQARLAWYAQLITDKPSAHGKLTNIAE